MTQTNSKEKNSKMRVKKCLPINASSNLYKGDKIYTQHKKNNKSMLSNENINSTFNISKPLNHLNKNNFYLSPNAIGNNNFNINNIKPNLSPTNQLFKNFVYFKTNANQNLNNNIYVKKAINKNKRFINHKKNDTLMHSYNYSF